MADIDTDKMLAVHREEMAGIPSADSVSLSSMRLVIATGIAAYIFGAALLGGVAGMLVVELAEWMYIIASQAADAMVDLQSTTPAGDRAMEILFLTCGVVVALAVSGVLAEKWISRYLDDIRSQIHYQMYCSEINAAVARIWARRDEFTTDNDRS